MQVQILPAPFMWGGSSIVEHNDIRLNSDLNVLVYSNWVAKRGPVVGYSTGPHPFLACFNLHAHSTPDNRHRAVIRLHRLILRYKIELP